MTGTGWVWTIIIIIVVGFIIYYLTRSSSEEQKEEQEEATDSEDMSTATGLGGQSSFERDYTAGAEETERDKRGQTHSAPEMEESEYSKKTEEKKEDKNK